MSDQHSSSATSRTSPAEDAKTVTPSDSVDLPDGVCKSFGVGVAGDVKVTTAKGTTLVIPGVPAGPYPLKCSRIWSTSTTATGIVAHYD
jgi:hypothetical protein